MLDTIRHRRSIRKFTDDPVPEEAVNAVLEAARWAPSGMNNQPWRFAVIRDESLKELLSGLTQCGPIIRSADVVIAVFLDTFSGYDRTKDLQSIGACIENILLAIEGLGLGGVWLGEIIKSGAQIRDLVGAPEPFEFMAAVAMGYPEGASPRAPARKPLSKLVFFRK